MIETLRAVFTMQLLKDVVEIAIIAAMLAFLINSLRGTRGAGIARGALLVLLGIFLAALFVAQYAQLPNLRWIMENLVGVSLVGLLVIFQPEIRRGLIHIGESAWRFYTGRGAAIEDEIADAAFEVARRGEVGALFVLERKTQIGTYIESGVVVDAVVSAKLLVTVFSKNTPLHDGAVIIRQGRIAAANCLLPLSENVEVCRGMGTRHRAAVGLTEEADSIVVIVSEETGAVSVANGGQIVRDLDYERLRAYLRAHLVPETPVNGFADGEKIA